MFVKIAVLASVLALAHSGLLDGYGGIGGGLGGGIGGGLGGGLGGYGGISLGGGEGGYGGHKETFIDYRAPPKYEYKYGVSDHHTGDQKEKVEERHGDLTKSQHAWAEKDRKVQWSQVIHGSVPVRIVGHHY